jgi:hypothetical protein
VKNYDGYLAPWVKWLDERLLRGTVVINSQLLKSYLEEKYGRKEYSSYMRIGRQIVDFMNRYLPTRIELIKSVSHKRDSENVQMPSDNMQ